MSFKSIGSFFAHLGEDIYNGLLKIFGPVAIANVEAQIKLLFEEDVQAIFVAAINAAESLPQGSDKRSAAFAEIVQVLETKGIALGKSLVNLGIEVFVNLLKSKAKAA